MAWHVFRQMQPAVIFRLTFFSVCCCPFTLRFGFSHFIYLDWAHRVGHDDEWRRVTIECRCRHRCRRLLYYIAYYVDCSLPYLHNNYFGNDWECELWANLSTRNNTIHTILTHSLNSLTFRGPTEIHTTYRWTRLCLLRLAVCVCVCVRDEVPNVKLTVFFLHRLCLTTNEGYAMAHHRVHMHNGIKKQ